MANKSLIVTTKITEKPSYNQVCFANHVNSIHFPSSNCNIAVIIEAYLSNVEIL